MSQIKKVLFREFGGFADKRIKKLSSGSVFRIDDRTPGDIGADGEPYSWFCRIHATVITDDQLELRLTNAPMSQGVWDWAATHNAQITPQIYNSLTFTVARHEQKAIRGLAACLRAIVDPSAPRYELPGYKYACPRAAASLEKLSNALDAAWPPGSLPTHGGGRLF